MKTKKRRIWLIVIAALVAVCACLAIAASLMPKQASPVKAPVVTVVSGEQATKAPAATKAPTATPAPTDTPAPTATVDPNAPLQSVEAYEFMLLSQEVVKKALKAPSTAKFPDMVTEGDQWRIGKNGDIVSIISWVDAENSFGAMLRNDFALQFSYSKKELLYLQLAGEEIYGTFQAVK